MTSDLSSSRQVIAPGHRGANKSVLKAHQTEALERLRGDKGGVVLVWIDECAQTSQRAWENTATGEELDAMCAMLGINRQPVVVEPDPDRVLVVGGGMDHRWYQKVIIEQAQTTVIDYSCMAAPEPEKYYEPGDHRPRTSRKCKGQKWRRI